MANIGKPNIQLANVETVNEAAQLLKMGKLVIFGADGVYAMCASINSEAAIKRVFDLKTRAYTDPLQVVVDPKDVAKYGKITTWHQEVLNKLMPGPVSFIVPNRKIPAYVNANMDSVSIGWQANWILMQLYRESGAPYVATSANPHGFPAPIVVEDAAAYFGDQIPIYIDNGRTKYGIPNAIVDLSKDPIQIVREGFNTFKDIEEMIAARVKIDRASAKPLGGD